MARTSRCMYVGLQVGLGVSLLLALYSFMNYQRSLAYSGALPLAAQVAESISQPAPSPLAAATDTYHDFDQPGTAYAVGLLYAPNPRQPEILAGGPDQSKFIRLAFATPTAVTHNSINFARTATGNADQIVADFDFRLTLGSGRADGFGFALLNTANYGAAGLADLQPPYAAEEPNFSQSLGIGFDIYRSTIAGHTEVNNNHLSLHYNGVRLQETAVPLDLASGQWLHARIVVRPADPQNNVVISLTACGNPAVVSQFTVAGLTPYESRVHLAARSGGETANHDFDNLRVQFLPAGATPTPVSSPCRAVTENNFDQPGVGTPYTHRAYFPPPAPIPAAFDGGPTGSGKALRLAYGTALTSHNSIAFDQVGPSALDQVVADFDFRIKPGTGRADGFGFALLNTSVYGAQGAVDLPAPFVAEEPNFAQSLGIGFDIYRSLDLADANSNHLSLHFDGKKVADFDATPALDLAGNEWIHARVLMRAGGGHGDVTVTLTQCGRPAVTVLDRVKVPGLAPYASRVHFAARAAGLTADYDLDNVRVQSLSLADTLLAFSTGCATVVETEGQLRLTVTRSGPNESPATINYATRDLNTTAGVDYTPLSGTLRFNPGELTKTISLPLLDDTTQEGDERLQVTLHDPKGSAVIAGPSTVQVMLIDDESARQSGHWSQAIPGQVLPIHAHLLPTGQVMYWDRHDEKGHHAQPLPERQLGWDGNPRLWDPRTETITRTAVLTYDIFCSGHAFLGDGTLLVAGGHITGTAGEDDASIYHPQSNSWTRLPNMNQGRWYPSNVTLANGDALVLGGTYAVDPHLPGTVINPLPQVWEIATQRWRNLTTAQHGGYPVYADYYPFLYVAPNGRIFNAGPQRTARYLDPAGTGQWTDVTASTLDYRDYGSSVMYDNGKVLIVGGNPRGDAFTPSASAEVINLNDANPQWRTVDPMSVGRRHLNTTLLPDGTVLVTGGSSAAGFDNPAGAALTAELWDPSTEKWTVLAAQTHYRGYHSVALLLPDGRVWVGGGGHPDTALGAQYNLEIFSPPYLFKGPRPTITSAPGEVTYDQQFILQTPNVATIRKVTWLRLSSVTHAFNQNQRINHLAFTQEAGGLRITTPVTATLAPPGHYMLFILNDKGVPSLAHMIRLGLETPVNEPPLPASDTYTTTVNTALVVSTPGVLANDTDEDNDQLSVSGNTNPTHGILAMHPTGAFTYTPTTNYQGQDSFVYTVSDGQGSIATATVAIAVQPAVTPVPTLQISTPATGAPGSRFVIVGSGFAGNTSLPVFLTWPNETGETGKALPRDAITTNPAGELRFTLLASPWIKSGNFTVWVDTSTNLAVPFAIVTTAPVQVPPIEGVTRPVDYLVFIPFAKRSCFAPICIDPIIPIITPQSEQR